MTDIRCMIVGQGASGLPEDRFVNTLHFTSEQVFSSAIGDIAQALNGLWPYLGAYISPYVAREYQYRFYDMADAEPRVPTIMLSTYQPVGSATGNVPEECAVCLSLTGDPPVTARRRGRIFIGPLTSAAVTAATASQPSRVSTGLLGFLITLGQTLSTPNAGLFEWCIWSPTTSEMVPITAGWVDNAFDTQRRRGVDATTRNTWQAGT